MRELASQAQMSRGLQLGADLHLLCVLGEDLSGVVHHGVDDGLGCGDVVDKGRHATNEEGSGLQGLLGVCLQVFIDREGTLGGQLLDLRLSVVIPAKKGP